MLNKMRKVGMGGRMTKIIKEIYREIYNKIKTEKGLTEEFVTTKRIKQRCPLSSTLFNIFLNDIDEEWERKKEGGVKISN